MGPLIAPLGKGEGAVGEGSEIRVLNNFKICVYYDVCVLTLSGELTLIRYA